VLARVTAAFGRAYAAARMLAVTIGAVLVGVAKMASGRSESPIVLQPGDVAPDFSLPGSDGRTYRLADYRGQRAVVLAWFPKAFTGG